jgi:hypothetical protein
MRVYRYLLLVLFAVLVCETGANAQDRYQQEFVWNGTAFVTPTPAPIPNPNASPTPTPTLKEWERPITVDDFVIIRGKFYDDDTGPIAIFVSLTDDKGRVITKYLAQMYEKTDRSQYMNGADILLFGPQFYDGYEVMKAKFTVFRLGDTKAATVFSQIKKYMTVVPTFMPGLSLSNPYTDFAMQLVGELIEKDKNKNKIAEFELPLAGLTTAPAIPQKWYVFGQGKIAQTLKQQLTYTRDASFLIPQLPNGTKVDGSVLLVGALRKDPDTSYRDLLDRLKTIETEASASKALKDIAVPGVDASDARAEQMTLDHLWFSLFAKLKLANDKSKSKASLKQTFRDIDTLAQLTSGGPPTGALVKLSDEKERLLTRQLIGMFGYQINGSTVPDSLVKPAMMFSTLEQWRNWFNRRCEINKVDDPCSTFVWKDTNAQQAPYAVATASYALEKASQAKTQLDQKVAGKPADKGTEKNVLFPAEFRSSMGDLLQFFANQPDDPWMLFEQVATARWIRQNFGLKAGGDDLPDLGLDATPEQVAVFASKLKTAIAETKLLKAEGGKYNAYPLVKFVWGDLFDPKLTAIKAKNTLVVNQHEELKTAYAETIGKYWSQMSDAEKADIKTKFSALLSGAQLKKDYSASESNVFFENTILSVTTNAEPVVTADPELLVTLQFYRGFRSDPDQFMKSIPVTQRQTLVDNYLKKPQSARDFSRQFIGAGGKPLAARQRAVKFLQEELVPSLLEDDNLKQPPGSVAAATAWHNAFTSFVNGKSWTDGCKCFGGNEAEESDLESLRDIDQAFTQLNAGSSSEDLKDLIRRILNFRFPSPSAPKTTRVKDQALSLLLKFTGLTLAAKPEIKDRRDLWEQTYLTDAVSLDFITCNLAAGSKSIIVVRGLGCPNAASLTEPTQPNP